MARSKLKEQSLATGTDFGTYTKIVPIYVVDRSSYVAYPVGEEDYGWFPNTGTNTFGMQGTVPEDYVSGGTVNVYLQAHDDSNVRKFMRYVGVVTRNPKATTWTDANVNWDLTTTGVITTDVSANPKLVAGESIVVARFQRKGDDGGDVGGRVEMWTAWFEYTAAKQF